MVRRMHFKGRTGGAFGSGGKKKKPKPVERTGKTWQKRFTPEEAQFVCKIVYSGHKFMLKNLQNSSIDSTASIDLKVMLEPIARRATGNLEISRKDKALCKSIAGKIKTVLDKRAQDLQRRQQRKN